MTLTLDKSKSNFGSQLLLRFHIWFITTLYDKMQQILLKNVTAIFLQYAKITYLKKRHVFYCNIQQL